jgi:predicted MFS family arabinose efflux permease
MLMVALVEVFCLMTMAISSSPALIIMAFILHHAIIPILAFNFDIFVQKFSKREDAGSARGTFLSIINICFVITPLIGSIILAKGGFGSIYLLSSFMLFPLIYFISTINTFKDSDYKDLNIFSSLKVAMKNADIRSIVAVNIVLQMFYSAMIIYIPLYLHFTLGFSLQDMGLIFTIMLIPFVIFEFPLGKISDKFLGEKEILVVGLIIMAFFTAIIPLVTSTTLIVWAAILFGTRVGASFVEIMAESYFFKKIEHSDTELLSLWRSLSGFSYIVIPVAISGLLLVLDLKFIFPLVGAICLSGVFFAMRLRDTL